MKIREAEKLIAGNLETIYPRNESENIARLLIEYITGLAPAEIREQNELENEKLDARQVEMLTNRLLKHEPIQYLMQKCWFYGLGLFVDSSVLIPRPETEELTDWVIKDIKKSGLDVFSKNPVRADETTRLKIIDICTGSGCIALALKKSIPLAEVWGCDISEAALNIARRNGAELDIRVDFQGMNFLDHTQQRSLPTVDIAVCNPPYIPISDRKTMQANVLEFEPHVALFVPDNDALVFYHALASFGMHRLHAKGCIYMEIHENLGAQVFEIFSRNYEVEIKKDMQGKERMVKARKK
jgi:release factor glutamine methyltransferase